VGGKKLEKKKITSKTVGSDPRAAFGESPSTVKWKREGKTAV